MPAMVTVTGLKEFRRDLELAQRGAGRDVTKAIKAAGEPLLAMTAAFAARSHKSGELEGGYKLSVRQTEGSIVSSVPYAAGAEWGVRGKWAGFNRYGGRGSRFAARAITVGSKQVTTILTDALRDLITLRGWAR